MDKLNSRPVAISVVLSCLEGVHAWYKGKELTCVRICDTCVQRPASSNDSHGHGQATQPITQCIMGASALQNVH